MPTSIIEDIHLAQIVQNIEPLLIGRDLSNNADHCFAFRKMSQALSNSSLVHGPNPP